MYRRIGNIASYYKNEEVAMESIIINVMWPYDAITVIFNSL